MNRKSIIEKEYYFRDWTVMKEAWKERHFSFYIWGTLKIKKEDWGNLGYNRRLILKVENAEGRLALQEEGKMKQNYYWVQMSE